MTVRFGIYRLAVSNSDKVQRALTLDGHEVIVTQDGTEALERLEGRGGRVDLLISDLQMPGLDGIELVEKGLKASPRLRIILMSGFVGELNRAGQQLKGKVACVIAKPFTLDDMRNTVKGVLG